MSEKCEQMDMLQMGHEQPKVISDRTLYEHIEEIPGSLQPVFLFLDTSGSMIGRRIDMLNQSIVELLGFLSEMQENIPEICIKVAVLEYSSGCRWMTSGLVPVRELIWDNLHAGGLTDFGETLTELEYQLSRRAMLKSDTGCKAPMIIFTTDGVPRDEWVYPMDRLWKNKWYQTAVKMAVAIGDAPDQKILEKLVGNRELVLMANDASEIHSVFHTMIQKILARCIIPMGIPMDKRINDIIQEKSDISFESLFDDWETI